MFAVAQCMMFIATGFVRSLEKTVSYVASVLPIAIPVDAFFPFVCFCPSRGQ